MIKIEKLPCPVQLTTQVKTDLTEEYKITKRAVWKKDYIEKTLLKSSHNKCCYCECKLDEESKYMEVEHFHDKSKYPDLVIEWDNLLPSCKRCNIHKSNFDTVVNPFVNPSTMNPREHLSMRSYRLYGKSQYGKNTIDILELNDTSKIVAVRFKISEVLHDQLDAVIERIKDYTDGTKTTKQNKNKILRTIHSLLREAQPDAEYSATVATEIISSQTFMDIIDFLKSESLWDKELDDFYQDARSSALI